MGTIDRSTVRDLFGHANSLDHGPAKVAVLEEAVRMADTLADLRLAMEARSKLIDAATNSGSPEKAVVAFAWCLAQIDRDPSLSSMRSILWEYKWIISSFRGFPQISRSQIKTAMDDFAGRLQQAGYEVRPVHYLRALLARSMGDDDESIAAFAAWEKSPRGSMTDCLTCELDTEVHLLAKAGQDEAALAKAGPILDGRMKCMSVPHDTLSVLLLPLLRLGRLEEAVTMHLKGYRMISRNRMHLHKVARHLKFLALTDNVAKGLKLFEAHLPWALATFDLEDRFWFDLSASLLFDRLAAAGKATTRLRLPESLPGHQASGKYDASSLAAWVDADAAEIAAKFNARNGNDLFTRHVADNRESLDLLTPFPVHRPRKGDA